jgi:hypothetical protein
MTWRLSAALSVLCAFLACGPSLACASQQLSFDATIDTAVSALSFKSLGGVERDRALSLLALARASSGPRWLGDRQHALDEALRIIGLPASRPPREELSRAQRDAQIRGEATQDLIQVDRILPVAQISMTALPKIRELRSHIAELIAVGQWSEASSLGTEALITLGAYPSNKC